jgi:hypothetical protein
MTFGLTCAGIGLLLFSQASVDTPYWKLAIALSIQGIGMASTMSPMTAAVMSAVGVERAGLGSAMTNTAREVGGVFGVALLGTILTARLRGSLSHRLLDLGLPIEARHRIVNAAGHLQAAGGGGPVTPEVRSAFTHAFMDGFSLALTVAGIVLLVAAAVANRFIPGQADVPERQPALVADEVAAAAHI